MFATYINKISSANPEYEINQEFIDFLPKIITCEDTLSKAQEIAASLPIEKRYSVIGNLLSTGPEQKAFYDLENFPGTQERMQAYRKHALPLAKKALDKLFDENIKAQEITHIVLTSCTGFYSPGLDIEIIKAYDMNPCVERTLIGFMGCHAAFNGIKTARHIVRSNPGAKVLMLNLELSSLHMQLNPSLDQVISFLLFADGCAASIISGECVSGETEEQGQALEVKEMRSSILPNSLGKMTWDVENYGFGIHLDKSIPLLIKKHVPNFLANYDLAELKHWAVHPGGKAVLEVIQESLALSNEQMADSFDVFRNYGNLSSATVMFVLEKVLKNNDSGNGLAMAFGPGLCIETMFFEKLCQEKFLDSTLDQVDLSLVS